MKRRRVSTTTQPSDPAPSAPREKRTFTAICAYCGQPFTAESDRARWCCPAHKQSAYRLRLARKAAAAADVTTHIQ